MATNEQRQAAAMAAAERGLRIVLLNNHDAQPPADRKKVFRRGWGLTATDNEDELERQFENQPKANIGVLLGKYPPGSKIPGVIDVEFDCEEGRATAEKIFGSNCFTPTYKSKRSVHRLFLWNDAFPPIQKLILAGLEIRLGGDGKQTQSVLPPSTHETDIEYQWLPSLSINEVDLAEVPEILAVQFCNVESLLEAEGLSTATGGGEGSKPPEYWESIENGAPKGSRNNSLLSLAGRWARNMVDLDYAEIESRAIEWGRKCTEQLKADECKQVAQSAVRMERRRRELIDGRPSSDKARIPSVNTECSIVRDESTEDLISQLLIMESLRIDWGFWQELDYLIDDVARPEILLSTNVAECTDRVVRQIARLGWDSPWLRYRDREKSKIYQRQGRLVSVVDARIVELPEGQIPSIITRACRLLTETTTKTGKRRCDVVPPAWLSKSVHTIGDYGDAIRRIAAVTTSPTFRPDGTVVQTPGYDAGSGLLYRPSIRFPSVPDRPSRSDAMKSASELMAVVGDFEFAGDADRSAWLAYVITLASRYAIGGCCPLFAITANSRGSGKSLLADISATIAYDRHAARKSYSQSDDENRKAITATALEGTPCVLFDNVADELGGPSLDAALTATTWTDRVLGKSQTTGELPMRTVWAATGNNLRFGSDLARRVLPIRLASTSANPEDRTDFTHPHLMQWVAENRPRLLVAALTIMRAYIVAGQPQQPGGVWGSFDAWSTMVRGAIVWVGLADPLATRETARSDDASGGIVRGLISGLFEVDEHGKGLTAREIADILNDFSNAGRFPTMREVVSETATNRGFIDAKKLAYTFRQYRGRIANGWTITGQQNRNGVTRWYSTRVSAGDADAAGDAKTPSPAPSPAHSTPQKTGDFEFAGDAGDQFSLMRK